MTKLTNLKSQPMAARAPAVADRMVAALIARVGERVRAAREAKGIPRRVLSEISGVSPRYLAQLEAGGGNISIALLQRVAVALDHRIEWLIGEDEPWSSEAMRVADQFRAAPTEVQQTVLRALAPQPVQSRRARRVCLIGLRGAGKSTLGQMAGQALNLPFIELNREIESHSGMPVDEVMALYGDEGYRKLEAQALGRIVAAHDGLILAVAGGIVAQPDTYDTLLSHFHTIWVRTSPDEHMSRVRAQGDTRPMAGNPEAMEQLKSILASREALYGRAEAQIDTAGRSVSDSLDELLALIARRGFLD
ncbi:MAG: helix-turn-helix transcriptional regulator [Rhodobacteraceae bacterium]|nr:helix-turn-helix transcriptional regulator [Paracoccaceae bacterium]